MEEGRAERDALLRRQVKVMSSDRFEQLVFALARREYPEVRRLTAPDGGADTLLPETSDRRARVWQAKRYTDAISWAECEKSLDRAAEVWKPEHITFAFSLDFTESRETSFQTRLVKRPSAVAIVVEPWTLTDIVTRLDEHEDIKVRFFGAEQESTVDTLLRTMQAGGQLTSGADLVERARTLSAFANRQDVDFQYGIASAPTEAPSVSWEQVPYIAMQVISGGERVDVAAWPREGADVETPSFSFTDDQTGRNARTEAVPLWARGEAANIGTGTRIQFHGPKLVQDMLAEGYSLGEGVLLVTPADPFDAELEVTGAAGVELRHLQVRAVPPRPGAFGALAGYAGNVLVELNMSRVHDDKHVAAQFTLTGRLGRVARESADAAKLLYAWCTHTYAELRCPGLLPEALSGHSAEPAPEAPCAELLEAGEFAANVAFIEQQLGVDLPLPDQVNGEELRAIDSVVAVLRTGEGVGSFEQASAMVDNPNKIPGLPDEFRRQGPVRRPLTQRIFGQDLVLGIAEYEFPELKVIDIIPHGRTPDAPARVVLAPLGDSSAPYRLVNYTPPK